MSNYLLSEKFSRFCKKHNLYEIWGGLVASLDGKPDLYGNDRTDYAFFLLLQHIYYVRRDKLLKILADLLADYAKKPLPLPVVRMIKQDLLHLGYSRNEVKDTFSITDR